MSRDWAAIYTAMLGKPKYRRLSLTARAALFHVWLLAGAQEPEATWPRREELADVLELDGFPPEALEELVARRWIDVDTDGRLVVHDWDEWQLAASESSRRAYERDRKQDWRRKRGRETDLLADPPSPEPLSTVQKQDTTGTRQDRTEHVSPNVPDMSGTTPGHHPDTERLSRTTTDEQPSTCPGCGDAVLLGDPDVVPFAHGELWHVTCPSTALARDVVSRAAATIGTAA